MVNNKIVKLDSFSSYDGHIESILIGSEIAKVSFQTWDGKALIIIFNNVESVVSNHSVYGDIGEFICTDHKKLKKYSFKDANNGEAVLEIVSNSIDIYDTGIAKYKNGALYDVGYEYIGNQDFHKYFNV